MATLAATQLAAVLLITGLRFGIAGTAVVGVNQSLGLLAAALAVAQALLANRALASVGGGGPARNGLLTAAALTGALAAAATLAQWVVLGAVPGSRYGRAFYGASGVWLAELLAAIALLLAARGPDRPRAVMAAARWTSAVALVGIPAYLLLYVL